MELREALNPRWLTVMVVILTALFSGAQLMLALSKNRKWFKASIIAIVVTGFYWSLCLGYTIGRNSIIKDNKEWVVKINGEDYKLNKIEKEGGK